MQTTSLLIVFQVGRASYNIVRTVAGSASVRDVYLRPNMAIPSRAPRPGAGFRPRAGRLVLSGLVLGLWRGT